MNRTLLLIPLLVMIILVGCQVKEPGSPKWDVEVTIPIADKTYPMSDLVADSTDPAMLDSLGDWISSSGDSLFINYADTIERVVNEDSLVADSAFSEKNVVVGIVTVEAPGSESTIYLVTELEETFIPGNYPWIDPFVIDPTQKDLPPYEEFNWVILATRFDSLGNPAADTNEVTVTIENNCPFPYDTIDVELWGVNPNMVIYSHRFAELIPPGGSIAHTDTIVTEYQIDNEMYLIVSGHSPGNPSPTTISESDNLDVNVYLWPMTVREAIAEIPEQVYDSLWVFDVESEDEIVAATFKEAYIDYKLTDETGIHNVVTFVLPGLTDEFGIPFDTTFNLPPNGEFIAEMVPLAGYTLVTEDNTVESLVHSSIIDSRNTQYYDSSLVYIKSNDAILIDFSIYNPNNPDFSITFSSFEAILQDQVNEIDPTDLEVEDVPDGLEGIDVAVAILDVTLTSTIGIDVPVNLEIRAYKEDVLEETMFKSLVLPAGAFDNPVTTLISFPDAAQIINVVPDKIQVTGDYTVGGHVTLSEEDFTGAYVEGSYILHAPFSVSTGLTTLEPEIDTLDSGFDNIILEANLTIDLESHVPLAGEAFILASKNINAFDNPTSTEVDTFFHVALPAAVVGGDGYVVESGFLSQDQTMTVNQLDLFAEASEDHPLYTKLYIVINSSEGQVANFHPDDYIRVGASGHFILDVDLEDEEGGGN